MKSFIAILLVFVMLFAFAACKRDVADDESTQPVVEETGRPGSIVTNAAGEYQTTAMYYLIPDENSRPVTEIVTDENGSQKSQFVTKVLYDYATYPGATQPPTVAPGNTMADRNINWPKHEFMSAVPVAADKISDLKYTESEKGKAVVIYINDMSYADYISYIEECKAAGFEQSGGSNLPENEEEGKSYIYHSSANGLSVYISYDTDTAPYRNCDVTINITDYEVSADSSTSGS